MTTFSAPGVVASGTFPPRKMRSSTACVTLDALAGAGDDAESTSAPTRPKTDAPATTATGVRSDRSNPREAVIERPFVDHLKVGPGHKGVKGSPATRPTQWSVVHLEPPGPEVPGAQREPPTMVPNHVTCDCRRLTPTAPA